MSVRRRSMKCSDRQMPVYTPLLEVRLPPLRDFPGYDSLWSVDFGIRGYLWAMHLESTGVLNFPTDDDRCCSRS
ncbi:hypothetical protein FOMPIDRAFT_120204 [Fomitopsis schrenkii]|uniref:Uncharacterized protein n=1 Tax=Fomitopsis schrenkii TaxID=2126942 RepID=S8F5C3_FOMSC|nr:hypothetical protein FOMPIDRAFT_120204 [Fomitopsis schrenkii]